MVYQSAANINLTSGIGGLFLYINNSMQGTFFPLIFLALFSIITTAIYFGSQDMPLALVISSFAIFFISLFFRFADLISTSLVVTIAGIMIALFIFFYATKNRR